MTMTVVVCHLSLGATGSKFSAMLTSSKIDFSVKVPSHFVRRHSPEMVDIMNGTGRLKTKILNLLKTVEIVFHRPNVSHNLLPPIMPSVSQVAKLLDVYLRHDPNFSQQDESVVATGNQRLFVSTA